MTRSRLILPLAAALAALATAAAADARPRVPVTAAGWRVTPPGKQVRMRADTEGFQGPLASALSPAGTRLLSVSSGASRMNSTDLFRLGSRARRISFRRYDAKRGRGVFYGVVFSPDGRRAWASGGGQGVVHAYTIGSRIKPAGEIPTPYFPAGLAYGRTPLGDRIYAVNNLSGPAGDTNPPGRTVTVIDPATNGVTGVIDLGVALQPYGVAFERTGRKAYVTNWLGRSVTVIDTTRQAPIRQVLLSPATRPDLADHPNAVVANPRRDEVYTANGNSDTVSVLDTKRGDRVAATIDVSLARGRLKGATPDGLTVSPDGRRLYVALAGENALAVVDIARRRTIGYIPTAWQPVDVDITPDGRRLVVTATNGADLRANRCAGPYAVGDCSSGDLIYGVAAATNTTATMTKGVVNIIRVPRTPRGLARLSARARRNNRVGARRARKPPYLRAIKHVIYVIKENRTYDQILGDVKGGRGDRTLTLFKNDSAPNHRALARRFTLFDNFYADADVSADGHSWSVSAGVTDYTNRTWPISYSPSRRKASRARDFENMSVAQQFLTEPLLFNASIFRPAAALTHGYLWDNAYFHGVSYRDYGEFTTFPADCHGAGNTSETTTLDDRRFGDHVDERFPGFNLDCSDHADRLPEWEREFRAFEAQAAAQRGRDPLPSLQFMRLPNDHTWGTRAGRPIPQAYIADNDLALGRLVDIVSHSRFWRSTAILVTEDDAQNGPDHIDAHRTVSYVISPYTQRRRTDHTHYDTVSMVATLEDLLGLPPMTIVDQRATRMWKAFNRKPDFRPYDARTPTVTPFGAPGAELNESSAPLARASASWNFRVEDATPEIPLNEAIWRSIKGRRSRMPAPRHDYIIGSRPVDAGD
jgi:YVTN family beta-propeller protein